MGYSFLGAIPDHWCDLKELSGTDWTPEQIKNFSIPAYTKANGYVCECECVSVRVRGQQLLMLVIFVTICNSELC